MVCISHRHRVLINEKNMLFQHKQFLTVKAAKFQDCAARLFNTSPKDIKTFTDPEGMRAMETVKAYIFPLRKLNSSNSDTCFPRDGFDNHNRYSGLQLLSQGTGTLFFSGKGGFMLLFF